ncbi:MAG: CopD family protein [Saprospiraceae bacterium]|nr:CopD family protein [Saprospiraceae bacterium]
MAILIFKSLHIIGAVAWFAGLFYLVRILVYLRESFDRPEEQREAFLEQFSLMSQRVYKVICNPAMMITWTFGIAMLVANTGYLSQGWLHVKLLFLVGLTVYHLWCKRIMNKLINRDNSLSSFQLRLLNELPTVFLVMIVLLAVLRNSLNLFWVLPGLIGFGLALYFAASASKKRRESQG